MKIIETTIPGLLIIEPSVYQDERGYFFESFQKIKYRDAGIAADFVQDNESKSIRGVIRGLHYQLNPNAQAKLVRVVQGIVYDVAIDLRKGSSTFGEYYGIELSESNKLQLFVPEGFAHGFSVLSETAIFKYKCDNYYKDDLDRAINVFDPKLNIDWKLNKNEGIVSAKDKLAPNFENAEMNFVS